MILRDLTAVRFPARASQLAEQEPDIIGRPPTIVRKRHYAQIAGSRLEQAEFTVGVCWH